MMVAHIDLGEDALQRKSLVRSLITAGKIRLGGNRKLKIYGTLSCASGKRMKVENRVFFATAEEAIQAGYRPCGHCMAAQYRLWKAPIQAPPLL